MQITITAPARGIPPTTQRLLERMLCPLTGLSQGVGFVQRSPLEPRCAIAGGELTGVHLLRGLPAPRAGSFHIGGSGFTAAEALIATLGETVERYAQHLALASQKIAVRHASWQELQRQGVRTAMPAQGNFFTDVQFRQPGFPFQRLTPSQPIGWIQAQSLIDGADCWIPAQLALAGYVRSTTEPQFMVGVTTGTAAHRTFQQALRNALLELIQIDAAIGHWHGTVRAVPVALDMRAAAVSELIAKATSTAGPQPRFYWLPSADLPGHAIACLLSRDAIPCCAIGLGCDLRLSRALYKAFLEAVAVAQLAKITLFRQQVELATAPDGETDQTQAPLPMEPPFYDLDANVGYYARQQRAAITERFSSEAPAMPARELPPDVNLDGWDAIRYLVHAFAQTKKELALLDLTTQDIADLGLHVARVWSPDTLSLPLPSAPPLQHPRFAQYGGAVHDAVHPYP
ncbi:MAG: YcaO-like family protein [Chloroflexi bacterium]|nr:YcaO-like family protein [Chloroflexota bacterium]